jgi:hypothetical protein
MLNTVGVEVSIRVYSISWRDPLHIIFNYNVPQAPKTVDVQHYHED